MKLNKILFLNLTLLATFLLFFTSCKNTSTFSNLSSTDSTSPANTVPSDSNDSSGLVTDIKKIVSAGESLSFNNLTGGVNSIAMNPVTGLIGVAYYDKNANPSNTTAVGALKYAFINSYGEWEIEVVDSNYGTAACGASGSYCIGAPNVAGGNTTDVIELAFTSTGVPSIAYVYGASLNTAGGYKQVRFAERNNTSGSWTISTAFSSPVAALATNVNVTLTVDPIKGVTLDFDTNNNPHLTFTHYTQTITNSSIYYAFRSSAGVWTRSVITSAVTGVGTISAVGQGINQSAGVYCAASDKMIWVNRVIDTALGIGKPLYISCTATNAAGACTAFNVLNLSTGCEGASCFSSGLLSTSNAGARIDVILEPTTASTQTPVIGIYSTSAPVNTLLTGYAPLTCDQTQTTTAGAWGAMQIAGAASQGLNGFALMSSGTAGVNFLAYLNSTTSIMINKVAPTNPGATWFATGTILETATVSSEGLGAVYDPEDDVVYVSYAVTPASAVAAIGNDLKVASGSASDITLAGVAGTFVTETIDNMVNAFPTTAVPMLSAARASNGLVGYSFFYQDPLAAGTDSKLYYGIRGGTESNPSFAAHTVTSHMEGGASPLFVGSYPSLVYDNNNNPVISFYNGVVAQQNLVVARSSTNGTTFSLTVVDDTSTNVGRYSSASTYGSTVAVAYYDVINTGLKFAKYTPGTGWKRFAVDGMAGTGSCGNVANDAGAFASLKFTVAGRPVISYQSQSQLKIAYASEAITSNTYTWSCLDIDISGGVRGAGISMALSDADAPSIVHFDSTAGTIRYVQCPYDVETCIASGNSEFVSSIIGPVGIVSTITTQPSIQITSSGSTYVSFYSATYQALALANKPASSSSWTTEYIDQLNNGASYISAVGQYGTLLLNEDELPLLFFRSNENWLKYFSREIL